MMVHNNELALGIIDAQCGFMPLEEGGRIGRPGFGELPVPEGEQIIPSVNALIKAFRQENLFTFTTQDWHPADTAHFSDEPNFTTTWPVHCVGNTPGSEIHIGIETPAGSPRYKRFLKGMEKLKRDEEDTSYSGYNATDPTTKETLPHWLFRQDVGRVVLTGLALDYCVRVTALDLRRKMGLEVTVALDATRGIAPGSIQQTLREFAAAGIRTLSTQEILEEIQAERTA
jgi:nicotinamidase/pyrazinamidase